LLLLGGVLPGWEGSGVSAAVGFVGSLRKAFKAGTGHVSMMPEKDAAMVARKSPRGVGSPPGPHGETTV
jgi:hypothetical protein